MTQEVKPVPRAAAELRRRLQELERIDKTEATNYVAEFDPDLDPGQLNFVLGFGKALNRVWWHEDEEGFLVNGPKPGTKAPREKGDPDMSEIRKLEFVDPATMDEPRDQFYTHAMNLGISEKAARASAYYCFGSFNMNDAAIAWQAITLASDIIPSQKKRLWTTWCSWAGLEVPPELTQKVERQWAIPPSDAKSGTSLPASGRRFIAMKGEVVQVDNDDASGMSFMEAFRVADQQQQKTENESGGQNGLMPTLIREMGENQRAMLVSMKPTDSSSQTTLLLASMDNQRRETDQRFAHMEEMRRKDDELAREREERRWDQAQDREDLRQANLTRVLEQLTSSANHPKNPFAMLDEILPGIGAKLLDNLINPPRPQNEFMVNIGEQGKLSLDDYERYSEIQGKRQVIELARTHLPDLFQAARDMAAAADRGLKGGGKEQSVGQQPVSQKDMDFNGFCVECLRVVKLPPNAEQFTCPYPDCGALQSLAGEVIATGKPEHTAPPIVDTTLQVEDLEAPSEEADPGPRPLAPEADPVPA